MESMRKTGFAAIQFGMDVVRLGKGIFAWRKKWFRRKGKTEGNQNKKAKKQLLRLQQKAERQRRRRFAAKWAKIWGRMARAVRRKYF